ncbi:uncharacterized protein LOC143819532 isoform X3 [Paroedura picta]|uniref:uncharacterized protein LOC143819532 isoform X3 n=1 Tax=Paroedura picta TaxID=143630 RepID=UPI0040567DD8
MAPKVPDNLKSRKKPGEPGKDAEKGPEETKNAWENIRMKLATPRAQQATIWMSGLMFLIAVMLVMLYSLKLSDVTEKFRAATRIHLYMQDYNLTYRGKRPSQTLRGANDEWQKLRAQYEKNDQLRRSINHILTKIAEGWIPFGGQLYQLHYLSMYFFSAKHLCNEMDTEVAEPRTDDEQNFLVRQVFKVQLECWIGLEKQDNEWRWKTGGTPKKLNATEEGVNAENESLIQSLVWADVARILHLK